MARQRFEAVARTSAAAALVALGLAVPIDASSSSSPSAWRLGPEGAEYLLDVYTPADGLPQNSVNDILQDRTGYLWVATFGGVARFDGVRFARFEVASTAGLKSNRALSLHEARDGAIWVGYQEHGVARIENGRATAFGPSDGAPRDPVWRIAETDDGSVWFSTQSGLYRRSTDGTFSRTRMGEATPPAFGLRAAGRDLLAGTAGHRLLHVRDDTVEILPGPPSSRDRALFAIHRDRLGALWVGSGGGLWRQDREGRFDERWHGEVRQLGEDGAGRLWAVGSSVLRLEIGDDGRVARVSSPLGDSLPWAVWSIEADREGSVWLGSRGGGLLRLRPRLARLYTREDGLPHDEVRTVTGDGAGGLWLTAGCGPPVHFADGRFEVRDVAVEPDCSSALLADRDGSLWFGWGNAVAHDGPEGVRVYPIDRAPGVLYQDAAGTVWVSMQRGLGRVVGERIESIDAPPGQWDPVVHTMLEARDGTFWIGSASGLVRFDGRSYRMRTAADGLPVGEVRTLHQDASGALWIGTYGGGLGRMKDGEIVRITSEEGLRDNVVSWILADDEERLWLNGNVGLSSASLRELTALAEGRADMVSPLLFGTDDGSAEGSGGTHPAGWKSEDGRLWFPSIHGLIAVSPAERARNRLPPPVVIERVQIGDRTADPHDAIRVPPGPRDIEVHYTALSLLRPRHVRFRYMLEGHDERWVEAGPRRVAYYSDVRPGHYTFRVIAANDEGVWNTEGASVAMTFVTPYWATSWFRGLAFLSVTGVACAFFVFRLRRIRAHNDELRTEARQRAETEARLRTVITHAPVVLFALDTDGTITFFDGQGLEALGVAPHEVLGKCAFRIYRDDPEIVHNLRRTLAGEDRAWTSRGGDLAFDTRTTPLRDASGAVTGVIGVATDVTARVRAEEQRGRLEGQLREAQKLEAVGQLAGGVAHDFNNLLTVIGGHAELLAATSAGQPAARHSVDEIRSAQETAAALTRQLLAFARRQVVQPVTLDLNAALARIRGMLRRVIGEHIDLDFDLAAGLDPIRIDPGQIEQVVINLIVNARDAMPRGGRVHVRTASIRPEADPRSSERSVELTVTDDGEGMTPDVRNRAFEPFFTTKPRGRGTGLGLATVFGIVNQCGGTIAIDSAPGRGTCFRIRFPAATDTCAAEAQAPAHVASAEGGAETILVAEDDESVRSLVEEMLRGLGYAVLVARDGPSATRMAGEHAGKIDVLLTDLVMPGQTGQDLASALLEARPGLRVVYMSGYSEDALRMERSPGAGPHGFVAKPFTRAELDRTIRDALR